MKKFIAEHPIWFVVIVSIVSLGLGFVISAFQYVGVPRDGLMLLGVLKTTALPLALIWWLGWWRETGFTTTVRNAHDLWLPLLLMLVPIMVFGTVENEMFVIILFVVLMFFTGLGEEALSRGLLVRAVLPVGKWPAVLIPSVLFGLEHITQFLFLGMPLTENLLQIADNIFFGIFFAAVFLRVGSLWPLIIIHTLGNMFIVIGGFGGPGAIHEPPIGMLAVMWVVQIAYAIYLLRKPLVVTVPDEESISENVPLTVTNPV